MNISPWSIYFWQLADKIDFVSLIASILFGIAFAIGVIGFFVTTIDNDKKNADFFLKVRNGVFKFFIVALSFQILTPRSKTIAMMVVIPKITESEVVKKDIPELYNIAIEALKNSLKSNVPLPAEKK